MVSGDLVLAWPLAIVVYNPLTKPYEPLTLLLVAPGGAIWLYAALWLLVFAYEGLFHFAVALWPPAKKIRTAFELLTKTLWTIFIG